MSPRNKEQNQQIREERREEILQAALRVFACKGLAAAKISDIAHAAGLSHGLVYHYFRSKNEIFTELVRRAFEASLGVFAYAAQVEGDPWERLRALTETILSGAFEGEGPYYFLMVIQAYTSDSVPQEVKDLVKEKELLYREYLMPLVVEGQKLGRIRR
ncbi:MAG: TetR family transcriptional regulator [Firmicutes bacterium]|nr:TetR family transcriptional regulator [Bacillota bacterium]